MPNSSRINSLASDRNSIDPQAIFNAKQVSMRFGSLPTDPDPTPGVLSANRHYDFDGDHSAAFPLITGPDMDGASITIYQFTGVSTLTYTPPTGAVYKLLLNANEGGASGVWAQFRARYNATNPNQSLWYKVALLHGSPYTQPVGVSLLSPVGGIALFPLEANPADFEVADGGEVPINLYPDLYDVIGTTFNVPGDTTPGFFCKPDLTGVFPDPLVAYIRMRISDINMSPDVEIHTVRGMGECRDGYIAATTSAGIARTDNQRIDYLDDIAGGHTFDVGTNASGAASKPWAMFFPYRPGGNVFRSYIEYDTAWIKSTPVDDHLFSFLRFRISIDWNAQTYALSASGHGSRSWTKTHHNVIAKVNIPFGDPVTLDLTSFTTDGSLYSYALSDKDAPQFWGSTMSIHINNQGIHRLPVHRANGAATDARSVMMTITNYRTVTTSGTHAVTDVMLDNTTPSFILPATPTPGTSYRFLRAPDVTVPTQVYPANTSQSLDGLTGVHCWAPTEPNWATLELKAISTTKWATVNVRGNWSAGNVLTFWVYCYTANIKHNCPILFNFVDHLGVERCMWAAENMSPYGAVHLTGWEAWAYLERYQPTRCVRYSGGFHLRGCPSIFTHTGEGPIDHPTDTHLANYNVRVRDSAFAPVPQLVRLPDGASFTLKGQVSGNRSSALLVVVHKINDRLVTHYDGVEVAAFPMGVDHNVFPATDVANGIRQQLSGTVSRTFNLDNFTLA